MSGGNWNPSMFTQYIRYPDVADWYEPKPPIDITKPVRLKIDPSGLYPRTIYAAGDGSGYVAVDKGGQTQYWMKTLAEVEGLYENIPPKPPYEFEFKSGATFVQSGKKNYAGPNCVIGTDSTANGANPSIKFSKILGKADVLAIRDHLSKWLESVA